MESFLRVCVPEAEKRETLQSEEKMQWGVFLIREGINVFFSEMNNTFI
jgi:hypothetical protein